MRYAQCSRSFESRGNRCHPRGAADVRLLDDREAGQRGHVAVLGASQLLAWSGGVRPGSWLAPQGRCVKCAPCRPACCGTIRHRGMVSVKDQGGWPGQHECRLPLYPSCQGAFGQPRLAGRVVVAGTSVSMYCDIRLKPPRKPGSQPSRPGAPRWTKPDGSYQEEGEHDAGDLPAVVEALGYEETDNARQSGWCHRPALEDEQGANQ